MVGRLLVHSVPVYLVRLCDEHQVDLNGASAPRAPSSVGWASEKKPALGTLAGQWCGDSFGDKERGTCASSGGIHYHLLLGKEIWCLSWVYKVLSGHGLHSWSLLVVWWESGMWPGQARRDMNRTVTETQLGMNSRTSLQGDVLLCQRRSKGKRNCRQHLLVGNTAFSSRDALSFPFVPSPLTAGRPRCRRPRFQKVIMRRPCH